MARIMKFYENSNKEILLALTKTSNHESIFESFDFRMTTDIRFIYQENQNMNYIIRKATHKDVKGIIEAHRLSIRDVCSKDYNQDQIAEWSGINFKVNRWCQTMDKYLVWVISDELKNIFGFEHLKLFKDSQTEIAGL